MFKLKKLKGKYYPFVGMYFHYINIIYKITRVEPDRDKLYYCDMPEKTSIVKDNNDSISITGFLPNAAQGLYQIIDTMDGRITDELREYKGKSDVIV